MSSNSFSPHTYISSRIGLFVCRVYSSGVVLQPDLGDGSVMELESRLAKGIYVFCLTIFLTGLASWAVLAHQGATGGALARSAEVPDAHRAAK